MNRRVLSALGIYIGAAWTGFGIVSWMVGRYDLDPRLEDALLWALIALIPAVTVLASKGSWLKDGGLLPRAKRWVASSFVLALVVASLAFRWAAPPEAALSTSTADNLTGAEEAQTTNDQRSIWIPFATGSGDESDAATLRLFSALIALDLEQVATFTIHNGYSFDSSIESAGIDRATAPPFALAQRVATEFGLDYWVEAKMNRTADSIAAEIAVREVATATAILEASCEGESLSTAADGCAAAIRNAIPIPTDEYPDLPIAELSVRDPVALATFQSGIDAQLLSGDVAAANERFAEAVALEPDAALPRFWHGLALIALNRAGEGLEQLREVRRLDFRLNERLRFQAAALYAQYAGLPDEALAALSTWAERYPGSVEAQVRLGQMLQSRSRFDEAAAAFERASQAAPNDSAPLQWLLALERRRGNLDRVVEISERALALEPENENVLLTRANVLMDVGEPEQAIETARRAAAASRNPVSALVTLARAHFRTGDFEEATALLDRAENEAVEDSGRRSVIALRMQQALLRHDLSTMLTNLQRLRETAPPSPVSSLSYEVQELTAKARLASVPTGATERLRQIAEQISEFDDTYRLNLLAYLGLGATFVGDFDRARASFEEFVALSTRLGVEDSQRFVPHWFGHVEEEIGNVERAAELFAEALKLDPANVELSMEAGRSLRKARRFAEARESLTEAVRRFPSYPEAQLELALVAMELRQPEVARRAVSVAVAGFAPAAADSPRAAEARALAKQLGIDVR